jgi:hypothetical protein
MPKFYGINIKHPIRRGVAYETAIWNVIGYRCEANKTKSIAVGLLTKNLWHKKRWKA